MGVGLPAVLLLAAALFCIGLYGAISKRSAVMVLMGLELMANAVNLNLIAFGRFVAPAALSGQVFALFLMVVAAAEIGLGLGLVLALYRKTRTVELDRMTELKG
jgi:NADH:ubiquinone oxidoreductase subunit K